MNNTTPGFTLLEVLIATAIAAIISVLLLQSITQLNNDRRRLDDRILTYSRASLVQHQIDRDMSGAVDFIEYDRSGQDKNAQQLAADQGSAKEGVVGPQGVEKERAEEREKGQGQKVTYKYPKSLFVGTTRNGMLDELTFFTSNPMQPYWGPKAGKPRPRIARVTYRLVPEDERTKVPSYALTRQEIILPMAGESSEINPETDRVYTIARGIHECKILYGWVEYDSKGDKAPPGQPPLRAYHYRTLVPTWQAPERPQKANEKYDPQPTIPSYLEMTMSFWNTARSRDASFTFVAARAGYYGGAVYTKEEDARMKKAEKETQQQAASDSAKSQKQITAALPAPPQKNTAKGTSFSAALEDMIKKEQA